MVADFVCRLLAHMEARGSRKVEVVLRDEDADMSLLPWIDDAAAVLQMWLPGEAGPDAADQGGDHDGGEEGGEGQRRVDENLQPQARRRGRADAQGGDQIADRRFVDRGGETDRRAA